MQWLRKLYRPLLPIYAPLVQRIRRTIRAASEKRRSRQQIKQQLSAEIAPYKVIVGAGEIQHVGWIATDQPALDITKARDWRRFFAPQSIRRITAEHVLEHLTETQLQQFLRAVRPYLTKDARIRIAVPDGHHPDPTYIEYVRPGGSGAGGDEHKVLYTYEYMLEQVQQAGFVCQPLAYYDAAGQFHEQEWDEVDGAIIRTGGTRFLAGKEFSYTSLIVDCWCE